MLVQKELHGVNFLHVIFTDIVMSIPTDLMDLHRNQRVRISSVRLFLILTHVSIEQHNYNQRRATAAAPTTPAGLQPYENA